LEAVEFEDDSVASTEVDDLDGLKPEQQHDDPDVSCERPSAFSRSDTVYLDAGTPLCSHAKQHPYASVKLCLVVLTCQMYQDLTHVGTSTASMHRSSLSLGNSAGRSRTGHVAMLGQPIRPVHS